VGKPSMFVHNRPMLARIGVAIVVALVLAEPSARAGSCTCDDKADLLNRLAEADGAIAGLRVQLAGMLDKEKQTGQPLQYTEDSYASMRERLQEVINGVTDPHANHNSAETNEYDCKTSNKAKTACLAEVTDMHEGVHRARCAQKKMTAMRLADVALEEMSGYNTERAYIVTILRALPCAPKHWFGTITYGVNGYSATERTIPAHGPPDNHVDGGKETSSLTKTWKGTIHVVDDVGTSQEGFTEEFKHESEIHGTQLCSKRTGIKAVSSDNIEQTFGADSTSAKTPAFAISAKRSGGSVSFQVLGHEYDAKISTTISSVPCFATPNQQKAIVGKSHKSASYGKVLSVPVTLSPDGLELTGSSTVPVEPEVTSLLKTTGVSFFATVNLYRVKK
jgi:hypothetical protein